MPVRSPLIGGPLHAYTYNDKRTRAHLKPDTVAANNAPQTEPESESGWESLSTSPFSLITISEACDDQTVINASFFFFSLYRISFSHCVTSFYFQSKVSLMVHYKFIPNYGWESLGTSLFDSDSRSHNQFPK